MIKSTPELEAKIKASGKPVIVITLEDLKKATKHVVVKTIKK